jgi:chondroitin 4-sulfotransferase 11
MICDRYKCIFVDVPKTGSTSIRKALGPPYFKPHLDIWQIAQIIEAERFAAYFKFGFVRNPWDRAVSLYERREGIQMRTLAFEHFIEWMQFASSACVHPSPHRYQIDWFVNQHGFIAADFIGKFENLQADWATVAEKIGAEPQLPAENANPHRARDYTRYYNERTRNIVAERFAVDIECFGYKFGE